MESSVNRCRREGEAVWTATGHERPVFFDVSGRRRRWVLAGGVFAGGASAFWLTALIAGTLGFSTLPSLRANIPLLAQRVEAHEVASVRRHHDVSVALRRWSRLSRATGVTVSRRLVVGQ
jgi:hypothetical protein